MHEMTERHHAFIIASYYRHIKETCDDDGDNVFIFATNVYGEERGRRMAERALRDRRPLDFYTYKEYSEWAPTQTLIREGSSNRSVDLEYSPDYSYEVLRCPWALQFGTMGLRECGALYCKHIDKAIVRGFNPELVFEVPDNLNISDHCIQIMRGAGFDPGNMPKGRPEDQEDFDYHCAHAFYTFKKVVCYVLNETGKGISRDVENDVRKEYGDEAFERIKKYYSTDFSHIREIIK